MFIYKKYEYRFICVRTCVIASRANFILSVANAITAPTSAALWLPVPRRADIPLS